MSEEIRKFIGERLKSEREALSWSQAALAECADVSKRAVASWEAGESTPGADALNLLSSKGIDVLYVLTGTRMTPAESSLSLEEAALLDAYRRVDSLTPTSVRQVVGQLVSLFAQSDSSPPHQTKLPIAYPGPRITVAGNVGQHIDGNATISAPQTFHVGSPKKQK